MFVFFGARAEQGVSGISVTVGLSNRLPDWAWLGTASCTLNGVPPRSHHPIESLPRCVGFEGAYQGETPQGPARALKT